MIPSYSFCFEKFDNIFTNNWVAYKSLEMQTEHLEREVLVKQEERNELRQETIN